MVQFFPRGEVHYKLPGYVLLLALGFLASGKVCAYNLVKDNISNSYSGCYFTDNGDGTSTASVFIDYKERRSPSFLSRALLVYAYDKNGRLQITSTPATSTSLNGSDSTSMFEGNDYTIFHGRYNKNSGWLNQNALGASFRVTILNSRISHWPAVAIQAGIFTYGDDIGEINGVAYIARSEGGDGSCKVITDPGAPPPFDINISVSAPDWNLGDLQRGQSDTTFSRVDQQLCFEYSSVDVQAEKFIIGVSNANGVVNNRYRLQHLSDTSQVVPYSLMLDNGSTRIQLPGNSTAMTLNTSGRTCFVPTFTTEVGKMVKDGDYSDVLNFTVTTKP